MFRVNLSYGKKGNKICATSFATSLQIELNSDLGVLPPVLEPVLQQIRLPGLFSFVVKRATSLVFNSVCSKVAKKFILSRFFVSRCTITNQENTAVKQKKFAQS